MGWTWFYQTAAGTALTPAAGTAEEFANQADAESWLGEAFRALLYEGVDHVTLVNDGVSRYTMSLHPQD